MNKVVLSSIIDIISGGTPKTNEPKYWDGNIGWLSVTDFNNDLRFVYSSEKKITEIAVKESNTKFLKVNDIIISARGTVGALAQIGTPMCFNQSCFGIRGKEGIVDNDYLYYALKNYVDNIIRRSQGSVFNTINLASFDLMEIDIAKEIPNQQSIAKVLSDLDAKIELNNQINQELEAMAKMLYDYWFVQFDFPNEEGKPYKSSGGKMVYNEEMKREIPEGWEVKALSDYAAIKKGTLITYKTADTNGEIKVVSAGLNFSYYHSKSNYPKNTITISASGANAGFINFWREPIFACDCTTVRGKTTADTLIILEFLKMRQEFIYKQARGSAQPHVYPKDIEVLSFPVPPIDLINEFSKLVLSSNDKITNNILENQHLSELRDWLLPMLMNGQVKVKDAVELVEREMGERLGVVAESMGEY